MQEQVNPSRGRSAAYCSNKDVSQFNLFKMYNTCVVITIQVATGIKKLNLGK